MKQLATVLFVACLALVGNASAQTPQPEPYFTQGSGNTFDFNWQSVAGRTYFMQVSENLIDWQYGLDIEYGDEGMLSWTIDSSGVRAFVRLVYTDQPTTNPDLEDFDGDGIGSLAELEVLHTDPLIWDTNGDGVNDGLAWQVGLGADTDTDGDGIPDGEDFLPLDSSAGSEVSLIVTTGPPVITLFSPVDAVSVP